MSYFNIVAQTTENTVVTEYEPVKTRSDSYRSCFHPTSPNVSVYLSTYIQKLSVNFSSGCAIEICNKRIYRGAAKAV